ncbi:hypothetical protein, partial [Escherichia coli]
CWIEHIKIRQLHKSMYRLEWPSNRVDELLPWNVVLTNK